MIDYCSLCATDKSQCTYCINNPMFKYIPKENKFTPKGPEEVSYHTKEGYPLYKDLGDAEIFVGYNKEGVITDFVVNQKE